MALAPAGEVGIIAFDGSDTFEATQRELLGFLQS